MLKICNIADYVQQFYYSIENYLNNQFHKKKHNEIDINVLSTKRKDDPL